MRTEKDRQWMLDDKQRWPRPEETLEFFLRKIWVQEHLRPEPSRSEILSKTKEEWEDLYQRLVEEEQFHPIFPLETSSELEARIYQIKEDLAKLQKKDQ